jgi:tetratricopeptide (TPR) repeat protein
VTVTAHSLSAEEHEAAGHWIEAASAYAGRGQVARGAELLEIHGESFKAAEMWKAAGDLERAAAQYEAAGAWRQAADLWSNVGHPLKQAKALEEYARSLELEETRDDEECAAAWKAAAEAFDAEGEAERAKTCRREVARCLGQPIITLDIEHEGLVLNAWSRLQFTMRNEGYGPAHNIIVRASGDEFEGQVMGTREIYTLRAGRERTERLDIRPLEYGKTVPLRVRLQYMDHAGEMHSCAHRIYIAVASSPIARRKGETISLFSTSNLHTQLAEAHKNLLLIRERKSQYVMDTDIPLQLIKRERDLIQEITKLEARLAQSGTSQHM